MSFTYSVLAVATQSGRASACREPLRAEGIEPQGVRWQRAAVCLLGRNMLGTARLSCRTRHELALENLALRDRCAHPRPW
jgi:hypothetical protein